MTMMMMKSFRLLALVSSHYGSTMYFYRVPRKWLFNFIFQSFYLDDEENDGIDEGNEAIDEDSGDIYYNRDIDEEQKYMDNFGEYSENTSSSKSRDFLPYGDDGGTQDKQDEYNLAEMQSAGMQLENPTSSSEADTIAQQDAINQMIYGDLGADTEMLDLDINDAAIGFELHSNQTFAGMPQNTFELESNSQTFDPVATQVSTVVEQPIQVEAQIQTQAHTQSELEQNIAEPSTSKMEETKPETGSADPKDSPIEVNVSIEPTQETANTLEQPTQATEMKISEPVDDQITDVVPAPEEKPVSSQTIEKANSDPIKLGKASTKSRSRKNSASTDEPKTPARRTRRTASQDTTNEVDKSADVDVPKTRLRKALSQQSLSSQGDGSAEITKPLGRTTRSASQKSLNEDNEVTSIERTRRGASQQKDLLETISEPKTPKTSKVLSRRASKQDLKTEQKETEMEVSEELEQKTLKRKNTKDKSESFVDLGDAFNAEESASSRRLRKAVSHTTLNLDIIEEEDVTRTPLPKRKRGKDLLTDENPIKNRSSRAGSVANKETRPPRAASQNSLNTIANEALPKTPRRKRAQSEAPEIETSLGDRFNAEESTSSRRLRKAVSYQTLSSIEEINQTPTKPKGRSKKNSESEAKPKRAASYQSLSSLSEKEVESPTTRLRGKKALAVEKQDSEPKTPSRRIRRAASEKEYPTETITEKKATKTKRGGAKKDEDTNSEASSIVSTRGRKTTAVDSEDSSVKSTKTKKVTRAASALPAIVEDEDVEPGTSTSEYLESSRLTRSQRSAIEKYAKAKVNTDPSTVQRSSSRTVKIEEEEDTALVESDTESLKSQTSKLSKKSKESEASSQRTTRSLRSKK